MLRLRHRGWYGNRPFVYKAPTPPCWTVIDPAREREGDPSDDFYANFDTFDEAITEAHGTESRPHGERPPIETVRALMQAAWS